MYDVKSERNAVRYGILDKMQALENDLNKIDGIVHVEFDIRDYVELRQVILCPKYDIDVSAHDYFSKRHDLLKAILAVCYMHGLHPSGDSIEDYGEHWYIVRSCDKSWPRAAH